MTRSVGIVVYCELVLGRLAETLATAVRAKVQGR